MAKTGGGFWTTPRPHQQPYRSCCSCARWPCSRHQSQPPRQTISSVSAFLKCKHFGTKVLNRSCSEVGVAGVRHVAVLNMANHHLPKGSEQHLGHNRISNLRGVKTLPKTLNEEDNIVPNEVRRRRFKNNCETKADMKKTNSFGRDETKIQLAPAPSDGKGCCENVETTDVKFEWASGTI